MKSSNNCEIKVKRIGYKGFNVREDGTLFCRDKTFEVGKVASVKGAPVICRNGIHFCWNLNDVHYYYNLATSVICEVEPLGEIVAGDDGTKCCTNELKVIRMLTKEEVLALSNTGSNNTGFVNTGNRNTGHYNTGDWNTGNRNTGHYNTGHYNTGNWNTGNRNTGNRNTGHYNTGDWNTGNRNTGHYNTGDWNTGNRNTGHYNTGHYNTGDWNTGNWNTGHYNTGDWNTSHGNTGFFNQTENKCYIFDKLSDMTPQEFRDSTYYDALLSAPFILTEWVYYSDEEKAQDKAKELIGGYLKTHTWEEACKTWWSKLTKEAKTVIKSIPNFDAKKFKAITGLKRL